MSLGEFQAMIAEHRGETPEPYEGDWPAPCVHAFDIAGYEWKASKEVGGVVIVQVGYRCPECGEQLGTVRKRIRITRPA